MKKKIIGAIVVVALAITTSWNYQQNKQSAELSDLAIANVEALAENESSEILTCEGWLGRCSVKCSRCGLDWWAIGSTQKGIHHCSY